MSMKNNKLAFPEIEDLIVFLEKNPSYSNDIVIDIAKKAEKQTLSPKQINVLIKAWDEIQSTGGKDPLEINKQNFSDLQKLIDFYKDKDDYDFQDDMIRSILNQSTIRILSDKQLNVLRRAVIGINSPKISFTEKEIKNFEIAFKSLDGLSRARVMPVVMIPQRVYKVIEKMKKGTYNEVDDEFLKSIVFKYKRKIYSKLFEYFDKG